LGIATTTTFWPLKLESREASRRPASGRFSKSISALESSV
jgi:hypothetical protein